MEPKLIEIADRKLIGMRVRTSNSENTARELWQRFKPRVKEIEGRTSTDFYSVQIFEDDTTFENLTPATMFEKWAAVEVDRPGNLPEGMETLTILGGTYAVFVHRGLPSAFGKTASYIYGEWMPGSDYELDARPHFEIMSEAYRADDPNAEEEVWLPVRKKNA